jgi:hypothetical protein
MKNKLTYYEQYGHYSYYVNDKEIDDLSEVKIKGKKYKAISRNNREFVCEMGREYFVNSTKYFLIQKVAGINVEIDLLKFLDNMNVYATKFSLYKKEENKPAWQRRII